MAILLLRSRVVRLVALLSICAGELWPSPVPAQTPQPMTTAMADSLEKEAAASIAALAEGRYQDLVAKFTEELRAALPAEQLQSTWQELAKQVGAFRGAERYRATQAATGNVVVVAEATFERAALAIVVAFDQERRISGLRITPRAPEVGIPGPLVDPPPYANPTTFREQEVTVGEGEWALPGTLTLPRGRGPFPAVVLVHGSGPHDRDESVGPNKPFRDLAWGLASRGIAVLRYDKRTRVHGPKLGSRITVHEETIEDALAAAQTLRGLSEIDAGRLIVLGHSLGGMLVPRIGAHDPNIAGFIVMAGPNRPFEDLLLEQVRYLAALDGDTSAAEWEQLATLERQVARVKAPDLSPETEANELPFGIPAAYWLDLRGYVAAEAAKSLERPILVLQGGRDYNVTVVDFDGWNLALGSRRDVALRLYPSLNHLFMAGEGKSDPRELQRPGNVAEEVIRDVADWIRSLQSQPR